MAENGYPPHKPARPYGVCCECGRIAQLRQDGSLRAHKPTGWTLEEMEADRAKQQAKKANKKNRAVEELRKMSQELDSHPT